MIMFMLSLGHLNMQIIGIVYNYLSNVIEHNIFMLRIDLS